MTLNRKYKEYGGTKFSYWLREQEKISSMKGYFATDIDFYWSDAEGHFMFIEEKCRNQEPRSGQISVACRLDKLCKADPLYRGFHNLRFEADSPEDGRIYWDNREITKDDLIQILRFGKKEKTVEEFWKEVGE